MINATEILGLAAERGFPRVSLYLSTPRGGADVRQGPIQMKNLLRDAIRQLRDADMDEATASDLLGEVSKRLEAGSLWQDGEAGLAIFASPEETRVIPAPLAFEPEAHVGDQFMVRPLFPLLMRDGAFFVLTATQDEVMLYRGSRFGLSVIEDPRLPASAAEVTGSAEIENAIGYHATARGGASIRTHALGESPGDAAEALLDEYARHIAKSVETALAGETGPLVLAADDRLLGKLRRAITRKDMAEESIREHPSTLGPAVLHERAYAIVRDALDGDRRTAIGQLEARLANGEAASDRLDAISTAAAEGRVDTLFVAADASSPSLLGWLPGAAPPPEDGMAALDRAILETLAHGGRILTRPVDRADDLPPVGALYRY